MDPKQSLMFHFIFIVSVATIVVLLGSEKSTASFNFYERKCTEIAGKVCNGPLSQGPTCKVEVRGTCKKFSRIKKCEWKAVLLGAPIESCWMINGACKIYNKICSEYEKICKLGYKQACVNVLRPLAVIKDELAWEVYKGYMRTIDAVQKSPIHPSIIDNLQTHYKADLKSVIVSIGSASDDSAITDCTHIHLPKPDMVNAIKNGDEFSNNKELKLFLHELRHVDQCLLVGGRKRYATMWFSEFETVLGIRADAIIRDLLNVLKGKGTHYVHDAMPMEQDAIKFANETIEKLEKESHRDGFIQRVGGD